MARSYFFGKAKPSHQIIKKYAIPLKAPETCIQKTAIVVAKIWKKTYFAVL